MSDPSIFAPSVYILSRAACGYQRLKLVGEKSAARRAAKLQAAAKVDFGNVKSRVVDADNDAIGVWTWDGDMTLENGAPLSSVRVLPESLARVGAMDGARLVECLDGVEGEIWRDGVLTASRWWPSKPAPRDWLLFLRAGRSALTDGQTNAPPQVETPVWRDDLPLIDHDPDNLQLMFSPSRLAAGVAIAFLFFTAIQGTRYLSYEHQRRGIETRVATAATENQEAYAQRRRARAALSKIRAISDIGDASISPGALLALAAEFPAETMRVSNFRHYDNKLEARIEIIDDNPDAPDESDFVRALETAPLFSNVYVERRQQFYLFVTSDVAPVIVTAPNTQGGT